jgi:hypothetical protein
MPLAFNSFEHQDTEEFLHLSVTLPYKSKDLDVYISDVYLKINSTPFLFELDLFDFILVPECQVVINGLTITFHLVKQTHGLWPSVKCTAMDIKSRRSLSIERESTRQQLVAKEKKDRKHAEQREQVRRQIQVEREKRERVDELKKQEQESSSHAIKEWAQQTLDQERKKLVQVDSGIFEGEVHSDTMRESDDLDLVQDDLDLVQEDQDNQEDDIDVGEIRERVRQMLGRSTAQLPPPRECTTVKVEFTPRNNIPTNTARYIH